MGKIEETMKKDLIKNLCNDLSKTLNNLSSGISNFIEFLDKSKIAETKNVIGVMYNISQILLETKQKIMQKVEK